MNSKRVDTTNRMLNAQNRRYSRYNISRMDSKPIFCTYYNISLGDSTYSSGLGMVYEKSGPNTPLRFNKINNVPIYGFKEFNRETNRTEYKGITLDINNEGLLPSSAFVPMAGDFLEIVVGEKKLLFEVSLATPTTILNDPHYRIAYSYGAEKTKDPQSIEDLYMNVIGEYDYIIENVGSNKVTLLDVEAVKLITEMTSLYSRLNREYMENYYYENYNVLLYKKMCYDNPTKPIMMNYYCPALVEFQRRCSPIMYRFEPTVSVELLLIHETMGYVEFDNTPYNDILVSNERGELNLDLTQFDEGGRYLDVLKIFNPCRYLTVLNGLAKEEEFVMSYSYPSEKLMVDYVYKQFKSKDAMNEDTYKSFIDTHRTKVSKDAEVIKTLKRIFTMDNIIEAIGNYKVKMSIEDFLFVPIVLYVLKTKVVDIQRNPRYLLDNVPKRN